MTFLPLRRYRESHRADEPVLPALRDHLRSGGGTRPEELEALSGRLGLPAAALRGALSYYADLRENVDAPRICRGTSCELAGAERLAAALEAEEGWRPVYCLGYCDRSPALLRDGRVCHGDAARATAGSGGGAFGESGGAPDAVPAAPAEDGPRIRARGVEPIVTRRIGRGDFSDLADARGDGAYATLEAALEEPPEAVLRAVELSGERGRGGAGFPTGRKWRTCAETPADRRYVVANGDEGDPGSFIDRLLMERDPHGLLEGMALCARAVGADRGVVFVRSEYPRAEERLRSAVEEARAAGLLGEDVLGTGFAFDVSVFRAMGSYVCGEETAMLNAIEGYRGEVRLRPPFPAERGLYGRPTVVNNVETLMNATFVVREGPEAYARLGTDASSGTKALCLNHGFAEPGVLEVEFGASLREAIDEVGFAPGPEPKAILLGGPMGSVLTPGEWDVPICYGAMGERGIQLGHGSLVAVPADASWTALLEHRLRFMADESCGRCVPCSRGSAAALERVRTAGRGGPGGGEGSGPRENGGPAQPARDREELDGLFDLIGQTSLCGFGTGMAPGLRRLLELAAGEEAAR